MAEDQRCCGRVWTDFRSGGCSAKGKIEREGKFYCMRHDPVRVEEKRIERQKQFNIKYAAWRDKAAMQERRKQMYIEMTGALIAIAAGHNDARGFAQRLVAEYHDVLNAPAEKEKTDA